MRRLLSIFVLLLALDHVYGQPWRNSSHATTEAIIQEDPSMLQGVEYVGRGQRSVWERRIGRRDSPSASFIVINAYLFKASYGQVGTTEIIVNPEFETVE